jgi:hypothetical protein
MILSFIFFSNFIFEAITTNQKKHGLNCFTGNSRLRQNHPTMDQPKFLFTLKISLRNNITTMY